MRIKMSDDLKENKIPAILIFFGTISILLLLLLLNFYVITSYNEPINHINDIKLLEILMNTFGLTLIELILLYFVVSTTANVIFYLKENVKFIPCGEQIKKNQKKGKNENKNVR